MMKRKWGILAAVLIGGFAVASPIKTWIVGEVISYTDLNANFAHIHSLMVGGHGPRLVNADVSANAHIAHNKLATPALIPKIWAQVANCSSNPCTVSATYGVASVGWTSAGLMTVNFVPTATRVNANYAAIVAASALSNRNCAPTAQTTTTVTVTCQDLAAGAANSGFTILIMDDN